MTTIEEITGVSFPSLNSPKDAALWPSVLDAIGACCARHLKEVGYFTEGEAAHALKAYQDGLSFCCEPGNPSADFIAFAAEMQAQTQVKSAVIEAGRMQKLLRGCLGDRVRSWSFGMLPGAVDGLYKIAESARVACGYLGCPSMLGGEVSIVHVTSVNPVASLVASAWIKQNLAEQGDGDVPFMFPLMTDLPTWQTMLQRHFGVV